MLTREKQAFLENDLLVSAQRSLARLLRVRPIVGGVKVGGDMGATDTFTCGSYGGVEIPLAYRVGTPVAPQSAAANADVLVFVTAWPTQPDTQSQVLAYARSCRYAENGRPIMGHINFSPRRIAPQAAGDDLAKQYATVLHELVHVLGFEPELFPTFLDASGRKHATPAIAPQIMWGVPGDESTQKRSFKFVLPTVQREARIHFGCPTLDGLELEDGGGSGSAGSHWEKRIVWNELMSATLLGESLMSRLTAALLQDSGWYEVDIGHTETLTWGRNKGCSFVLDQCNKWTGYGYELCPADAPSSQLFCSFDALRRSSCTYRQYFNLPVWAKYVPEQPLLGGPFVSMDYCSPPIPSGTGDCRVDGATTSLARQRALGRAEGYGPTSRCVLSSLGIGVAARIRDGRCMVTRCTGDNVLELRLQFNGTNGALRTEWLRCPQAGGPVSTPNTVPFVGELYCPPHALVCCAVPCSRFGTCVDGICQCQKGYSGARCETSDAGEPIDVLPDNTPATCGNGAVDPPAEQCDESAESDAICCLGCRFRPPTYTCRKPAGIDTGATCDQAELCTGASQFCPADQVRPKDTVCRDSVNNCDFAEKCDGASPNCGIDVSITNCDISDTPLAPPASVGDIAVIVGAVVGGVFLAAVATALLICMYRRRTVSRHNLLAAKAQALASEHNRTTAGSTTGLSMRFDSNSSNTVTAPPVPLPRDDENVVLPAASRPVLRSAVTVPNFY
jgi:leishmanolysin